MLQNKDIFQMTSLCPRKGLFTLPDPDSDSKPDGLYYAEVFTLVQIWIQTLLGWFPK